MRIFPHIGQTQRNLIKRFVTTCYQTSVIDSILNPDILTCSTHRIILQTSQPCFWCNFQALTMVPVERRKYRKYTIFSTVLTVRFAALKIGLGLSTHMFVKVPRPRDSEVTFSVFE